MQSSRGENDYRYYDEANIRRIKQIIFLRKLRFSIPSIHEIFISCELAEIVAVFSEHLDETKRETDELNALGIVLSHLLMMLKDKQNIDSIYQYLDTTPNIEAKKLKAALKTILSEPAKPIEIETMEKSIVI